MNHTKIAAALHALADAFLEGVAETEQAVTGRKPRKVATDPTPTVAVSAPAVPDTVAAEPAPVEPPPAPVSTITKDQLNKAVLKVAAKSRETAEKILARFGAKNTVTLPQEQWQAVYDAFEEEIAKIDAVAVQVAQASLV
jgi:hypothetical protein